MHNRLFWLFFGCLIQQQDTQTKSMVFVPNQTQSAEDIRWYWAHGRNTLGAGHVSGLGMVHLLLLHLERTQVNRQGEAKQHVYCVCVFLVKVAITWTCRAVSAACLAWQMSGLFEILTPSSVTSTETLGLNVYEKLFYWQRCEQWKVKMKFYVF